MFRIVQFQFPYKKLIELAKDHESTVDAIRKAVQLETERVDGVPFFVTEPMSTTSSKFYVVEQYARSLFGDPSHFVFDLVVDLTSRYRLLRTRAPQSYDYAYVVEIGTMQGEFGEERLVAMPARSVEYQSGRYSSGMYTPVECS